MMESLHGAAAFLVEWRGILGFQDESTLLYVLAVGMIAVAVPTFVMLQSTEAPYGRYGGEAHWLYGPHINGTVAWIVQEAPSFFIGLWAACSGGWESAPVAAKVLIAMYLFHYTNRSFIYPLRMQNGKPTPIVVCLMALFFCFYNGYLQIASLTRHNDMDAEWHTSPQFILGVVLFFSGMYVNWQADGILRNLRTESNPEFDPKKRYYVPKGGAFDYVSGANFFGEILEWTGFAIAAGTLAAVAFALFTFCNIGPRGAQHHKWYLNKFREEYPKDRKAVIPFLW